MNTMHVIGNWKMHGSRASSRALALGLVSDTIISGAVSHSVQVTICPPSTFLTDVHSVLEGSTLALGAQDCHYRQHGAHTGDVSALMLRDAGCTHVILGHSERRRSHNESNDLIAGKVIAALEADLRPIICVGETLEEHQQQRTIEVVTSQLQSVVSAAEARINDVIVAYEPVWAIGTGLAATAEHVTMAHAAIAEVLAPAGGDVPILYGGSVTADNAPLLFACPNVHGGLIGGASLEVASFSAIVQAACKCMEDRR